MCTLQLLCFFFFFFNDTATTEIYTLSLHDALPICFEVGGGYRGGRSAFEGAHVHARARVSERDADGRADRRGPAGQDRKSTRLNSSHLVISYAVFCLKKKKKTHNQHKSQPQYVTIR